MLLLFTVVIGFLHVQHALCQVDSDDFLQSSEMDFLPSEYPYLMTEFPDMMESSENFLMTNYPESAALMQPSASPVDIFPSSVLEMVQESSSVMDILTTESQTSESIVPTATSSTPVCQDRTGQCDVLGLSVCSDFRDWSRYYCPLFCNDCEHMAITPPTSGMPAQETTQAATTETTTEATTQQATTETTTEATTQQATTETATEATTQQATIESTTTTTTQEQPSTMTTTEACCLDQLGWEQCLDYRLDSCQEPYRAWASARCQAFCGMCKPCPIDPCEDKLDNCDEYGTESCTGNGFRKWAMQNCRKHCGLCTNYGYYYQLNNLTAPTSVPELTEKPNGPSEGSVTGSGTGSGTGPTVGPTFAPGTGSNKTCRDKVIHCTEYGLEDCSKYSKFMSVYCPKYCSFCSDSIAVTQGPTTTESGSVAVTGLTAKPVIPADCGDKLSNCTTYPEENCCGIYEPWARAHCASHCGFCGVAPQRLCHDTIDYCAQMNEDMCTNDKFRNFRESHCAGFCKLCDTPWTPPFCAEYLFKEFSHATQKPTPAAGLPTVNPCKDALDDCLKVPLENCCGPYEPWARAHCANYCGYCGAVPDRICHDTIDYCDRMNDDLCTNEVFLLFRETKCAGFCKICDTPWKPPSCTAHLFQVLPTPTSSVPGNMVG